MRKFRLKHNLTQYQLAKLMKVNRSTLSCWEIGIRKPSFWNRIKIAWFYIKYHLRIIKLDNR